LLVLGFEACIGSIIEVVKRVEVRRYGARLTLGTLDNLLEV
jgi:hypothetical protein